MKTYKIYHPVMKIDGVEMMLDIKDYFNDFHTDSELQIQMANDSDKVAKYCQELQNQGKLAKFGDFHEKKISADNVELHVCVGFFVELIDESVEFPFPYIQKYIDLINADPLLVHAPKITVEIN